MPFHTLCSGLYLSMRSVFLCSVFQPLPQYAVFARCSSPYLSMLFYALCSNPYLSMPFYARCSSLDLGMRSMLVVPALPRYAFYARYSSLYLGMRSMLDVPALTSVCLSMLDVPALTSVCLSMLDVPAFTSVCILCSVFQPPRYNLQLRYILSTTGSTTLCSVRSL